MNLLTLLRTNKYTQKQMEFLLGWPAGKASRMILVPHRINTLLIDKTKRGSYPLGVCKHSSERNRPFFMRINKGGKILYGSYFADPLKAHAEWQREKVCAIKDVLSEYEGQEFYDSRVGLILKSVCSRIESELESGQETKYLLNEKENTNVES